MLALTLLCSFIELDNRGLPLKPLKPLIYRENFSWNPFSRWRLPSSDIFDGVIHVDQTKICSTRINEQALIFRTPNSTSAIYHKLGSLVKVENSALNVQFEVRTQSTFECSEIYIQIFSNPDFNKDYHIENSPFLVFGPKHCQNKSSVYIKISNLFFMDIDTEIPVDDITHLYQIVIRANNTIEVLIDTKTVYTRTLSPPLSLHNLRNVSGVGLFVHTEDGDVAVTNIAIGTNERDIKRWNRRDFSHRQLYQIKKMKQSYTWIDTSTAVYDHTSLIDRLHDLMITLLCVLRYKHTLAVIFSFLTVFILTLVVFMVLRASPSPYQHIKVD